MDADETDLLSAGETARILRVSRRTVDRWADRGWLTHVVTLGGHRRFPRSAVEAVRRDMRRSGGG
ncbi:MAG: helix-turn-helix domain-containing protein [Acidimicrobiia bacterium]|jgi:excisionase family DNA binding protein